MTDMNDDVRVAEIMGYTLWSWVGFHKTQSVFPPGLDPVVEYPNSEYKKINWDSYNGDYCTNKIKPFRSAPTHATDGIVLEWVQGQDDENWFTEFTHALIRGVDECTDDDVYGYDDIGSLILEFFLRHYKPGDYAQALLETRND